MRLSKQTLHRMENIRDFCDFDIDNRIATLHVNFKSIDEIIDIKRSTPKQPVVSEKTYDQFSAYMKLVPREFTIEFSINVDDYKGYDPDALQQAYKSGIKKSFYSTKVRDNKLKRICLFMSLIGLVMIAATLASIQYGWFGPTSSIVALVIVTLLEIFSEIFFEEGLVFFIFKQTGVDLFKHELRRLHSIKWLKKNISSS